VKPSTPPFFTNSEPQNLEAKQLEKEVSELESERTKLKLRQGTVEGKRAT